MSARRPPAAMAALGLATCLAGCSTAAGRVENGTFHSAKGYAVTLPRDGWHVQRDGRADLELKRDAPAGGMLADATCEPGALERPLPVLARHLTFGLSEREPVQSEETTVQGRPAARAVVRGVVDGAPVAVEALVVKSDRCVHDFLYVAPEASFQAGRAEFRSFVESLALEAARR